jgi:hypothetical protein
MAAPKGNSFWEARSSHGRKPIFASPDELWDACVEYFEWVEANPLWEDNIISFRGAATHVPVAKLRPMTLEGLYIFLDISHACWQNWREHTDEDFVAVVTRVEQIIRTQKFSGAVADLMNPNIIARDLGLADRKEHSGPDGAPLIERVVLHRTDKATD